MALHPLGRPFGEPLPPGVHDLGVEVWSQPDAFVPYDPPGPEDAAIDTGTDTGADTGADTVSQAELWEVAAAGSLLTDGGRLFSGANPASPSGLACFTEPLLRGGSVVLVAHADPDRIEATYTAERATSRA